MVITTHSMEEADALCTRIAIMAGGKMAALGSQLRLKASYGDGYRLSLTLAVPPGASSTPQGLAYQNAVAAGVHAFVLARVHPAARVAVRVGSSVTYLLPREDVDVASIFGTLEAQKVVTAALLRGEGPPDAALITEFGLSQPSLEQVFIEVAGRVHASTGTDA
jgi:ABC-type multidrug transport system ATPase subunit